MISRPMNRGRQQPGDHDKVRGDPGAARRIYGDRVRPRTLGDGARTARALRSLPGTVEHHLGIFAQARIYLVPALPLYRAKGRTPGAGVAVSPLEVPLPPCPARVAKGGTREWPRAVPSGIFRDRHCTGRTGYGKGLKKNSQILVTMYEDYRCCSC